MDRGPGSPLHGTVDGSRPIGPVRRVLTTVAAIAGLAGLAFLAGIAFGTYQDRDGEPTPTAALDEGASSPADGGGDTTVSGQAGDEERTADGSTETQETDTTSVTVQVPAAPSAQSLLRFAPFDQPVALIDAESDPTLNNSVGAELGRLDQTGGTDEAAAIIGDLVVVGSAGTTVAVHPGDRPADAIRFTIPAAGRLLVQHLLVVPDDAGRIAVSASDQVDVDLIGHGRYLGTEATSAGRFVSTDSVRVGSLVTATDGRTLRIDLADALGDEAEHVDRALVRLNANVGPSGGSVTVGSGDPLPWAAPATADLAMAGTELLTVTPTDGEIEMEYLGGSVMTVDLIGYYTNDGAPASTDGLLVLADRPAEQTIEMTGQPTPFDVAPGPDRAGVTGGVVTIVEVANGETPGLIRLWADGGVEPTDAAFAVAPNQQRSTTAWLAPASTSAQLLDGPPGATARVWTLGYLT